MTANRLLLDSGVLLIFVVGHLSPELVRHHKKLKAYDAGDFQLLEEVTSAATTVVATPHRWAEVSNLLDYGVPASWRSGLWHALKSRIGQTHEHSVPSRDCAADTAFFALGLTDAGLLKCLDATTTLLTIDSMLFEYALAYGGQAKNFNHIREARGLA